MRVLQRNWDARAALNFMLGGAGSGLMVLAPFISPQSAWPTALALGLVAAGLASVWLEIGRKLRAVHVFFNPFTSWMTRESFAALMLFPLAIVYPPLAVLAALAFLYCQARILRAAKGIPAWRAPELTAFIVATGLAEGTGLALLFTAQGVVSGLFALAVIVRLFAWRRYRRAVRLDVFVPADQMLLWIGTLGALALAFFTPLAGLVALAAGWWLKLALVTRASFNQGFSLPRLPVRGAR